MGFPPDSGRGFHEDLSYYSTLPRPAVVISHVRGGAEHPEANLTGGIPAQYGSVLEQDDLHPFPSRCDSGASPGQTSSNNGQIGTQSHLSRTSLLGGVFKNKSLGEDFAHQGDRFG